MPTKLISAILISLFSWILVDSTESVKDPKDPKETKILWTKPHIMAISVPAIVDSGGKKVDSNETKDRSTTPLTMPKRAFDSIYKNTLIWVTELDTTGENPYEHISWENIDTIRKGIYWLMRDSAFVIVGMGCIKITGRLGRTPLVPDTVFIKDTCATVSCLKAYTVELGCWDSVSVLVKVPYAVKFCDTICWINDYYATDTNIIIITEREMSELKLAQLQRIGRQCDTSRTDPDTILGNVYNTNICIKRIKRSSNHNLPDSFLVNFKELDPNYRWRNCPDGQLCDSINLCCIDGTIVLMKLYSDSSWKSRRIWIKGSDSAWKQVPCSQAWSNPTLRADTVNCYYDSGFFFQTELQPRFISAGRDTTIYVDTCQIKCPRFTVRCGTTGYNQDTCVVVSSIRPRQMLHAGSDLYASGRVPFPVSCTIINDFQTWCWNPCYKRGASDTTGSGDTCTIWSWIDPELLDSIVPCFNSGESNYTIETHFDTTYTWLQTGDTATAFSLNGCTADYDLIDESLLSGHIYDPSSDPFAFGTISNTVFESLKLTFGCTQPDIATFSNMKYLPVEDTAWIYVRDSLGNLIRTTMVDRFENLIPMCNWDYSLLSCYPGNQTNVWPQQWKCDDLKDTTYQSTYTENLPGGGYRTLYTTWVSKWCYLPRSTLINYTCKRECRIDPGSRTNATTIIRNATCCYKDTLYFFRCWDAVINNYLVGSIRMPIYDSSFQCDSVSIFYQSTVRSVETTYVMTNISDGLFHISVEDTCDCNPSVTVSGITKTICPDGIGFRTDCWKQPYWDGNTIVFPCFSNVVINGVEAHEFVGIATYQDLNLLRFVIDSLLRQIDDSLAIHRSILDSLGQMISCDPCDSIAVLRAKIDAMENHFDTLAGCDPCDSIAVIRLALDNLGAQTAPPVDSMEMTGGHDTLVVTNLAVDASYTYVLITTTGGGAEADDTLWISEFYPNGAELHLKRTSAGDDQLYIAVTGAQIDGEATKLLNLQYESIHLKKRSSSNWYEW